MDCRIVFLKRCFRMSLLAAIALSDASMNGLAMAEPQSSGRPGGRAEYPAEAIRLRQEGDTRLSMCIGLDGKARDVKVIKSSGSEALDRASVEQTQKYAVFKPGRDSAGNPVEWCDPPYELTISWRLPKQ